MRKVNDSRIFGFRALIPVGPSGPVSYQLVPLGAVRFLRETAAIRKIQSLWASKWASSVTVRPAVIRYFVFESGGPGGIRTHTSRIKSPLAFALYHVRAPRTDRFCIWNRRP